MSETNYRKEIFIAYVETFTYQCHFWSDEKKLIMEKICNSILADFTTANAPDETPFAEAWIRCFNFEETDYWPTIEAVFINPKNTIK